MVAWGGGYNTPVIVKGSALPAVESSLRSTWYLYEEDHTSKLHLTPGRFIQNTATVLKELKCYISLFSIHAELNLF